MAATIPCSGPDALGDEQVDDHPDGGDGGAEEEAKGKLVEAPESDQRLVAEVDADDELAVVRGEDRGALEVGALEEEVPVVVEEGEPGAEDGQDEDRGGADEGEDRPGDGPAPLFRCRGRLRRSLGRRGDHRR